MSSAANSSPETVIVTKGKKFLIVPIIFRKKIEQYISRSPSRHHAGFLFGEDRENFSIIKKVWTIEDGSTEKPTEYVVQKAKSIATTAGLNLLGLFFTDDSTEFAHTTQPWLDRSHMAVQLVVEEGTTKAWLPFSTPSFPGTIIEQKIIL